MPTDVAAGGGPGGTHQPLEQAGEPAIIPRSSLHIYKCNGRYLCALSAGYSGGKQEERAVRKPGLIVRGTGCVHSVLHVCVLHMCVCVLCKGPGVCILAQGMR